MEKGEGVTELEHVRSLFVRLTVFLDEDPSVKSVHFHLPTPYQVLRSLRVVLRSTVTSVRAVPTTTLEGTDPLPIPVRSPVRNGQVHRS